MNDDQENEMTYDPQPEPEAVEDEDLISHEKKSHKKRKSKKRKEEVVKVEKQKLEINGDDVVRVKALKNFMLWDKTMVREGEVVEVPKPYAERLLTHTPKAFERA